MKVEKMPEAFICRMAEGIKLMGHPERIRIIEYLELQGESTVGSVAEALGAEPAAISQHLTRLRHAGLIGARRESRQVFCRLISQSATMILSCMRQQYAAELLTSREQRAGSD